MKARQYSDEQITSILNERGYGWDPKTGACWKGLAPTPEEQKDIDYIRGPNYSPFTQINESFSETGLSPLVPAETPTTAPPIHESPGTDSPYRFTIDPIGLHRAGDAVTITGTTSLPGNPEIWVDVICIHLHTAWVPVLPCNATSGPATLSPEYVNGYRRWSFVADTSEFAPDHYLVEAGKGAAYPGDSQAFDSAHLYLLLPDIASEIDSLPVTIDPVPSPADNKTIRLQGSLADYSGEELTLTVSPGHFQPGGVWSPEIGAGGVNGSIRIAPGIHEGNTWTYDLDTTNLGYGDYSIEIRSPEGKLQGYGIFSTIVYQYSVPTSSPQEGNISITLSGSSETPLKTHEETDPSTGRSLPVSLLSVFAALGILVLFVTIKGR
jgi:hypothetical protein